MAVRPLKDGVIADYALTEKMLLLFLQKVLSPMSRLFKGRVRIMVGVPSGVTDVERRAVVQAVSTLAHKVYLIEEPLAAAIGAGINVAEPTGSMVVDIGGGSTDIAVISLGGIVRSESLRIAGNEMDQAIILHIRQKYNLLIGERTAEELKIRLGRAKLLPGEEKEVAEVRGRDLLTGLPRTAEIPAEDIVEALQEPLSKIFQGVRNVLESTPRSSPRTSTSGASSSPGAGPSLGTWTWPCRRPPASPWWWRRTPLRPWPWAPGRPWRCSTSSRTPSSPPTTS